MRIKIGKVKMTYKTKHVSKSGMPDLGVEIYFKNGEADL